MILDVLRDLAIAISLCVLIPLTLMYGLRVFLPHPSFVQSPELERLEREYSGLREKRDQLVYDQDLIVQKKVEEFKRQQNDQKLQELEKQLKAKDDEMTPVRQACDKQFGDARKMHDRLAFLISAVIGIMLLLSGLFFPAGAIGAGMLFGGTGCIVVGYLQHMYQMSEKMHFFAFITAIVLIIAIGYLFFKRRQTSV